MMCQSRDFGYFTRDDLKRLFVKETERLLAHMYFRAHVVGEQQTVAFRFRDLHFLACIHSDDRFLRATDTYFSAPTNLRSVGMATAIRKRCFSVHLAIASAHGHFQTGFIDVSDLVAHDDSRDAIDVEGKRTIDSLASKLPSAIASFVDTHSDAFRMSSLLDVTWELPEMAF